MVAIPVGPVGFLIIQRSITVNALAGLCSGIGAALADGVFGFLAALGLVALVDQMEAGRHFLRPMGSVVLIIVGIYFFFRKPPLLTTEEVLSGGYQRRYWWDLLSSFFLTLLNPMTIIAFAALFAGSDLVPDEPHHMTYLEVACGIFTGSLIWWLILVALAQPIKNKLSPRIVHRVFQGIGITLIVLALVSFVPRSRIVIDKIQHLIETKL